MTARVRLLAVLVILVLMYVLVASFQTANKAARSEKYNEIQDIDCSLSDSLVAYAMEYSVGGNSIIS